MAHYLTFDNLITCTVNGVSVSSGYELHDGDVIVASTNMTSTAFYVNDDGSGSASTIHPSGDTVDIYDSDVAIALTNSGGSN